MDLRQALRRSPLYGPYTRLKYQHRSSAREELFEGFYRDNIWGDAESRSGSGSNLTDTERLRAELPALLRSYGIVSLLDVPCGDWAWMQHVDLEGIDYIGGDLVSVLVEDLQRRHGRPGVRFQRIDLVSDPLPHAEALMVRDLLLHLPMELVHRAIGNITSSRSFWLLTSHYPDIYDNDQDIRLGQHRFLNMTLPPFNWPEPVDTIHDGGVDRADKQLAMWRVSDLR